jgi:glycosyltransferase involved in cell wall biosynthesis
VRRERCGYTLPPADPDAFADALILAADQRAQLPGMGARARALAGAEFERGALAERFVGVLEQAIAR